MANNYYKTWFFDCDGVLLDSNSVKTEAFYETALKYGRDKAEAFVKYHQDRGGISRFEKFKYFFEIILGMKGFEEDLALALEEFGVRVKAKLMECQETKGLREFLGRLPKDSCKIVISGGEQSELREVFQKRKLVKYFDNIFGSPDDKLTILKRETESNKFKVPAIFIGDTQYDYECAQNAKVNFIFMTQYTEFKDWPQYFKEKEVKIIGNLGEL